MTKIAEPTTAEIRTRKAALPPVPVVTAQSMLNAQSWKPSAAELAAIKARADFFEWVGLSRDVHVAVHHVYSDDRMGDLVFSV